VIRKTNTIVDVVLTNCKLKSWCETSFCSISDHKAVLIALDVFSSNKIKPTFVN
jgi:hypothetical protein